MPHSNSTTTIWSILGGQSTPVVTPPVSMEDLINRASGNGSYLFHPPIAMKKSDFKYVDSIASQLQLSGCLTVKQRTLMRNIIKRYITELNTEFQCDVTPIIVNQVWTTPIKEIAQEYKISYDVDTKKLLVQFPYDEELVKQIQNFRKEFAGQFIYYSLAAKMAGSWTHSIKNPAVKNWEFDLNEYAAAFLSEFGAGKFSWDQNFTCLVDQLREFDLTTAAPILDLENDQYVFKNVDVQTSQPLNSIVEALYTAKQNGIRHRSEAVKSEMNSLPSVLIDFFNSVDTEKRLPFYEFDTFQPLFKLSDLTVIAVPAVNKLLHLQSIHRKLDQMDVDSSAISVMFRLSKNDAAGDKFNQYVKNHGLNQSLNNQTRVVLVSERFPKPLAEYLSMSKRTIDMVVTFGEIPPHYLLKSFILNHHNLIEFDCLLEKGQNLATV